MKTRIFTLITMLMTVTVLLGSVAVCGADAVTVSYRASENNLLPGNSFTVTVSLDTAADIKSLKIDPTYDGTVFELVSAKWLLSGTTIAYADGMPALAAFSKNATVQGDIFSFTFRVKEGAPSGESAISIDVALKTKPDGVETELPTEVQDSIVLSVGPFSDGLIGDINEDGTVDVKDLTRLMKYLAGETVTVTEPDLTGDGTVNAKDLTRLMKIISGAA